MLLQMSASACAGIAAFCFAAGLAFALSTVRVEGRSEEKSLPIFLKISLLFAPNLLFLVRNELFENMRSKTREQILMAGYDQVLDAERFLAARIILLAYGLVMLFLTSAIGLVLFGVLLLALMALWPTLWLNLAIRKRHGEIQKALPNVLDLLTLSVEAGKDFLTALRDILTRRRRDALTEELEIAFREIQLGKVRRVALKDMANRVKQHDLTAVVNAIAQADELGVSIGNLLRIQGDQLRQKRFQRAEKLANEAPVKILAPVVLFIFPSVFIILLGPILMQAFATMFQ